jgi:hypothetical protein
MIFRIQEDSEIILEFQEDRTYLARYTNVTDDFGVWAH